MNNLRGMTDYKGKGLWILSLLLLGGTIFFLIEIDRLRSSNHLTESDLLEMIQVSETPLSTTSATPISDEVILPFAQQQPVKNTPVPQTENNPMVRCQIHANCGGGVVGLAKSICENATCCQMGNNWLFYTDKAKCESDQKVYAVKLKQLQNQQQNTQSGPQQAIQQPATNSSNE